jgi:hypothetical protein
MILHKCNSQMGQIIGYIIIHDGIEVPAVWSERGECFSRLLGNSTKFDEMDLATGPMGISDEMA